MTRNHFITIVAGDDYKSLMSKYDINNCSENTIVFKIADAERIRQIFISTHEQMLKDDGLNDVEKNILSQELEIAKSQSPKEFYYNLTCDYDYDNDGNAITDKNIYGKYTSYAIGQLFSVPFTLKNGDTSFSAKKGDIDWSKMHMANSAIYEAAWDMVMGDKKPESEEEKIVYENMKNRTLYFQNFGDRETYVASNTAFWGYAFLSEESGWVDMEDYEQFPWIMNFFDLYISPLSDDTTLTIIECRK
jgi:hypothetical protein